MLAAALPPTTLTVSVIADETTIYGEPWDGTDLMIGPALSSIPLFGNVSTKSPPDIGVCLVANGEADCRMVEEEGVSRSLFHDRYDAHFEFDFPQDGAFGLFAYDIDDPWWNGELAHDLIGMVVVEGTDTSASVEVDQALRAVASQLTPTNWKVRRPNGDTMDLDVHKAEHQRRAGPLPHVRLGECAAAGCRLQQAIIILDAQ